MVKRILIGSVVAFALLVTIVLVGCNNANPGVGYEAVLVEKPMIFGHGGVYPDPVKTGFTFIAPSTSAIYVNMQPIQEHVKLDDLMTSDGVPLGFDAVVRLQITDSVGLISTFGEQWYQNNVERNVVNFTRQAVRKHGMNETAIQPTAIEDIDKEVSANIAKSLIDAKLPVRLLAFTAGKANPPDLIRSQRVETAAQQQRILTEGQKKLAEDARKAAELSRAEADNAYRNQMSLSPDQFLQLEAIKMKQSVCTSGAKCTFIDSGGRTPLILDGK